MKYPYLIKNIQDSIQTLLPENQTRIVTRYRYNCIDISSYSNWWEEWLGWKVGQGSKVKQKVRIPGWIQEKEIYVRACLRGLIETDGSVYLDRGYTMVNFTSVIPTLAQDTFSLILSLGFSPNIYKVQYKTSFKYVIRISKGAQQFIQKVGIDKS